MKAIPTRLIMTQRQRCWVPPAPHSTGTVTHDHALSTVAPGYAGLPIRHGSCAGYPAAGETRPTAAEIMLETT